MRKRTVGGYDLSRLRGETGEKLEIFALVNPGLVQSMASGIVTPVEAIERFYNAKNCFYVKSQFRNRVANEIMIRGVQVADIFDSLKPRDARREFAVELGTLRALSLKLLASFRSRRDRQRVAA